MASTAVSGSSAGFTPTLLTSRVTVPSRSASTQAARWSRPRWGRPGSSTQPEATSSYSGNVGRISVGGCRTISPGGWCAANCPGSTALSPTPGPSAMTRPTVPGAGSSGSSSLTRKTVLVCNMPGTLATRTARSRNLAHSTVLAGHRPETRNPLSKPSAWKGATSTDLSSGSLMVNLHRGAAGWLMVYHIVVSTQDPLSANEFRDDERVTRVLRTGLAIADTREGGVGRPRNNCWPMWCREHSDAVIGGGMPEGAT